jgi:hypothetical protein
VGRQACSKEREKKVERKIKWKREEGIEKRELSEELNKRGLGCIWHAPKENSRWVTEI